MIFVRFCALGVFLLFSSLNVNASEQKEQKEQKVTEQKEQKLVKKFGGLDHLQLMFVNRALGNAFDDKVALSILNDNKFLLEGVDHETIKNIVVEWTSKLLVSVSGKLSYKTLLELLLEKEIPSDALFHGIKKLVASNCVLDFRKLPTTDRKTHGGRFEKIYWMPENSVEFVDKFLKCQGRLSCDQRATLILDQLALFGGANLSFGWNSSISSERSNSIRMENRKRSVDLLRKFLKFDEFVAAVNDPKKLYQVSSCDPCFRASNTYRSKFVKGKECDSIMGFVVSSLDEELVKLFLDNGVKISDNIYFRFVTIHSDEYNASDKTCYKNISALVLEKYSQQVEAENNLEEFVCDNNREGNHPPPYDSVIKEAKKEE